MILNVLSLSPVVSIDAASPPMELVQALLCEAGIRGEPAAFLLIGASTSHVWTLTVDRQRYVMRHRSDGDAEMARKEVYLSKLLRNAGVPSANVLALVSSEEGVATLSPFLRGIRLDQATEKLSPFDVNDAWLSTGEWLRRAHEIVLPEAGEIVGERVEPFPRGWAQWLMDDMAEDIHWLCNALDAPRVVPPRLEQVISAAIDALRDAPVRLVHNDALPQNVLVAPGAQGWVCTGWLDWEFARAADPLWDLGTLDFRPAGLVPPSFYSGYGLQPPEPQTSIYELLMAIWRTRAELQHGSRWTWPPQAARIGYLRTLPDRIDRLAALLGVRK